MLGNQELQGEPQDKLSSHLEPDQEVAAVLGAGTLYYNVKYRYSHHVPTDNEYKLEEIAICCGFNANICHSHFSFFFPTLKTLTSHRQPLHLLRETQGARHQKKSPQQD